MSHVRLLGYGPLCFVLLLSLSFCHRKTAFAPGAAATGNAETLLIMLSEARAWQRRADLYLSEGDVAAAIASIKEVLAIPFPSDASEAEDVRLDACARLAKLYLSSGGDEGADRALLQIEAGRKLGVHDSFFRAHLEMVAADVYEARANRLPDAAARQAEKRKAIAALDLAIQIDRRLQRALINLPAEDRSREKGQKEGR